MVGRGISRAVCGMLVCLSAWYGPSGARAQEVKLVPLGDRVLDDFEDGRNEHWAEGHATTLSVEEGEHAGGKKWLHVVLKGKTYTGLTRWGGPGDWSRYRALRFSVYNPYEDAIDDFNLRIDDPKSRDYWTWHNRRADVRLRPGVNHFEVTVASLAMGSPGCRGLDLRHIRMIALFLDRSEREGGTTLYLDDVRLIARRKVPSDTLVLADFDGKGVAKWRVDREGKARIVKSPDARDGSALKLSFPAGQQFPGVVLQDMPGDWLNYDLLAMDVFCAADGSAPRYVFLSVLASDGTRQWLCTGLGKGRNRLRLPLALASAASLGRVRGLTVFTDIAEGDQTITIDNVRLERRAGIVYGATVHDPEAEGNALTLDFSEVNRVEGMRSFRAVVWIPLTTGATRVVYCNAERAGRLKYAIDAKHFEDADPDKPVAVWACFRSRGCIHWTRLETEAPTKTPLTLAFRDLAPFGM